MGSNRQLRKTWDDTPSLSCWQPVVTFLHLRSTQKKSTPLDFCYHRLFQDEQNRVRVASELVQPAKKVIAVHAPNPFPEQHQPLFLREQLNCDDTDSSHHPLAPFSLEHAIPLSPALYSANLYPPTKTISFNDGDNF